MRNAGVTNRVGYPIQTLNIKIKNNKIRSSSESQINGNNSKKFRSKFFNISSVDRNPNLKLTLGKNANKRKMSSFDDLNFGKIKFITINDKRNLFANSRKSQLNLKFDECKKLCEKKIKINTSSSSRYSTSQDRSSNDPNLLNPCWIPIEVQRNLLELHSRSRANLSKSETNLNRTCGSSVASCLHNSDDFSLK